MAGLVTPTECHSHGAFDGLVWLEPDLRDAGGHFLDLSRAMRTAATTLGLDAAVVGSRKAPATIGDLAVIPALDRLSERHAPRWAGGYLLDPLVASRRIEMQLGARVTPLCGPRTLVVASSVNHRHYGALATWLDGIADAGAPSLAVMLRVSELDTSRGRRRPTAILTRRGLRALERTSARRSVRLLTDTDELAREYGELTSLPVAVVPTPYLIPDSLEPPPPNPGRPLRLGFFGQARGEKGFPVLVAAIDRLAARGRLDGLTFTVQCYVRAGYEDQAALDAASALADAARLLPEMLEPDTYVAELAACDAVLLPYAPDRYRSRTSGVFVDALAAGRPVVTTAGSWMARQLEHHGAGVVYEGATGDALADAIEELRTRWPTLRSAAAAAGAKWRVGRHPSDVLRAVVRLFT